MAQIPEALLGYGLRRQRPPGASTWLSWAWRAGPAHPVLAGTLGGATTQTPREPRRLEQTTRTLGAQATRALLDAPPLPVQMETTIKPSSGLPWGPSGQESPLPPQEVWVQSLVGELRSCMPWSVTKKQTEKHP